MRFVLWVSEATAAHQVVRRLRCITLGRRVITIGEAAEIDRDPSQGRGTIGCVQNVTT